MEGTTTNVEFACSMDVSNQAYFVYWLMAVWDNLHIKPIPELHALTHTKGFRSLGLNDITI